MASFNPTTKTQEAIQQALQKASARGNPDIRPAHLLEAILTQEDGIAAPVLQATGVDPVTVAREAGELVAGYPKAEGQNMANPNFNRMRSTRLTPPRSSPVSWGTSTSPQRCYLPESPAVRTRPRSC